MDYANLRVVTIWKYKYTNKYHIIFPADFDIDDMIVWFHMT